MNEAMAAAVLVVAFLLAVGDVSGGLDCSPSAVEATSGRRSLSAVVDTQRAEQSRRQHLEALFNRYGENGSISLDGLKRLLQSVGLDRIRTVLVKHREQAGHHHHEGHHHHHHHNGGHLQHGNRSDPRKILKPSENRTKDSDSEHHLQNIEPTVTVSSAPEVRTTVVNSARLVLVPQARSSDQSDSTRKEATPVTAARVFMGSQTQMVPLSRAGDHDHDDHHDDDDHDHDHDDHNHDIHKPLNQGHSQNRSMDQIPCLNASSLLASHGLSQEVGVVLEDFSYLCPALLNQIDMGACVLHGEAPQHHEREHKQHKHAHGHHGAHNHSNQSERGGGDGTRSISTAWLGGFLSITIISLLSLLGVVLIPLMNKVFFKFLLSFLVALAVGTLSGDAFLHLIPHSQGSHQHHEEFETSTEEPHLHDGQEDLDAVWKGLTALSGVYFMFLIEHFLTLGKMYKDKKQKIQKKWDQNDKNPEKLSAQDKPAEDVETNGAGVFGEPLSGGVAEEEQVMLAPQVSVISPQGYDRPSSSDAYTDEDCENKCHSHFHDTVGQADSMHHHHHDYHHILHHHHSQNHHPHSHSHSYSEKHFQQAGVATLAWMVIMGDGLHNFSDGLAIGAAFTEGLSSGLSTSVAVFCHELPHELGDFAVLLKAGMTVRQAILYNVLSAMMAYFGMVTGILIGHYAENICMWIFALTAGLFMYVALVDMVPEMLHNDAGDHGFSHCGFFLLQNAGILLGFCIMLLIALFEHRIQLDLGV
ncbi:zinc transporter ZIP6 [Nematolebias whitei]|uniref:zinc transporter ZIP6 n=1 Tax=Nematolebias whitei TaxID=451745 RepID=UPI0018997D7A|nr:zinc transporter ZIP6 [Nematolebias whitei]XP_037538387.1 zinc transporter ZIP6 [Nematolebias whitei]